MFVRFVCQLNPNVSHLQTHAVSGGSNRVQAQGGAAQGRVPGQICRAQGMQDPHLILQITRLVPRVSPSFRQRLMLFLFFFLQLLHPGRRGPPLAS